MTLIFRGRRLARIAVLALATLPAACSTSEELDGRNLPASEIAAVRGQVDAAVRVAHGRLGAFIAISELAREPRSRTVLQKLGFVAPASGAARAFTPAAFAAGTRLDRETIAFDLASESFSGIRSVTVASPGIGRAGARQYVVELRVRPLASVLASALARAGALECADLGGDAIPLRGEAIVPAVFYTAYDPAEPNAGQMRAGLAGTIRPDCPHLR